LVGCLLGCKSEEGAGGYAGEDVKPISTGAGGTVYAAPPKDAPDGGYVVAPANPNDPKFKPDPKLAGSGGTH